MWRHLRIFTILASVCVALAAVVLVVSHTVMHAPPDTPTLEVEGSYELGTVEPLTTTAFDIQFRNSGTVPLHVNGVVTSCGCTVATIVKHVYEPGEHGSVHLEYHSGAGAGEPVAVKLGIESNDPKSQMSIVTIRGVMAPALTAYPAVIHLGNVRCGEQRDLEFRLVGASDDDLFNVISCKATLPGFENKQPALRTSITTSQGERLIAVCRMIYSVPNAPGHVRGEILVSTSSKYGTLVHIPFDANVMDRFACSPNAVLLRTHNSVTESMVPLYINAPFAAVVSVADSGGCFEASPPHYDHLKKHWKVMLRTKNEMTTRAGTLDVTISSHGVTGAPVRLRVPYLVYGEGAN